MDNTQIIEQINTLIGMLQNYKKDLSKKPTQTHIVKKFDYNKINDILDTVNSNFSDRDKIEYIEIRKAVKANKGWSPTIDEISMTYCDSNEYCILNTKNKYVLARYDDTNRETLRKAHTKLIEKYKQMKNELLNGSSQNDTQQSAQQSDSQSVSPNDSQNVSQNDSQNAQQSEIHQLLESNDITNEIQPMSNTEFENT